MNKYKILYLSRNMKMYGASSYQQDVMDELNRQSQVFFYGPEFNGYNLSDSIHDIISKMPYEPHLIILGHAWLDDKDGNKVDPHPNLKLSKIDIPKIIILNKEYVNINEKLNYIKQNRFDIGFTHHHDTDHYAKVTGIEFKFWPFAYNPKKFNYFNGNKTIGLAFSGVLQNLNKYADQSDIRARIMEHLYFTWMDVPLLKKKSYSDINIVWNSISRKRLGRYLSAILGKRKFLDDIEYSNLVQNCKLYINTLSPMGLVSPRFFECMGSGAMVFCEDSSIYKKIFPDNVYVTFKKDLSDFNEKLSFYLKQDDERIKIIEKAHNEVQNNHTWEKRVIDLLQYSIKRFERRIHAQNAN